MFMISFEFQFIQKWEFIACLQEMSGLYSKSSLVSPLHRGFFEQKAKNRRSSNADGAPCSPSDMRKDENQQT